jgi:hypothetical protein
MVCPATALETAAASVCSGADCDPTWESEPRGETKSDPVGMAYDVDPMGAAPRGPVGTTGVATGAGETVPTEEVVPTAVVVRLVVTTEGVVIALVAADVGLGDALVGLSGALVVDSNDVELGLPAESETGTAAK